MRCTKYRCRMDNSNDQCCIICTRADCCVNPCLNDPAKCGLYRDQEMKALSLWQPWATLKARGIKIYETRSWETGYRGPIAIHAAKLPLDAALRNVQPDVIDHMRRLLPDMDALPLGCIVGIGNLIECHLMTEEFIAGLSEHELLLGDFRPGRYAWEFTDMAELREPVSAIGHQGLWNWGGGKDVPNDRDGIIV